MVINVFIGLGIIVILGSILVYLFPGLSIDNFRKALNHLVLYLFLPALIFKVIYTAKIGHEFWQIPILAFVGIVICIVIAMLVYCFFSIESRVKGALILATAFGNVTYFGIAVLQSLFPRYAIPVTKVAILFEITLTPMGLIIGSALAAFYGNKGNFSLSDSLLAIAKMPLLWVTLIAFLLNFNNILVPKFVLQAASLLANAVGGLMILSLGMSLKYGLLMKALRRSQILLPALSIKLIVSPIIIFFCAKWLTVKSPYFHAATIEAAMPTQLILLAIADRFDLDVEMLAILIALATVISFITIPLVHTIIGL